MSKMSFNSVKLPKQDSRPYVIFHPSPEKGEEKILGFRDQAKNTLIIMSIDVGIKNLAIRIDGRSRNKTKNGRCEKFFASTNIEPFRYDLFILSTEGETTGTANIDPSILLTSIKILDDILKKINIFDMIVIERQLPMNVKSTRMYQHLITYLMLAIQTGILDENVLLLDVYPSLKYDQLGAPSHLNKKGKKIWGTAKAKEFLENGEDTWSIGVIRDNSTKADDLADVVIQVEALLSYLNL